MSRVLYQAELLRQNIYFVNLIIAWLVLSIKPLYILLSGAVLPKLQTCEESRVLYEVQATPPKSILYFFL